MLKIQAVYSIRTEKYKMLEALREACEGKMFLEKEYAAATKTLCEYLEADGKTDEGTKIIQEILELEVSFQLENS